MGNYELVPGFVLTISKHGNQLKAQATGKAKHFIYPKSDSIFYFKVLPAEITFNKNEVGKIIGLTLVQEDEKVIGKRIKE